MIRAATPSILVVDDEVDLAEILRDNLLAAGYRVEVAHDGDQALEVAERGDFDLIVLDVMLPGRDGFTICDRLRRRGSSVPVIFLTARRERDDRIRGLEVGGDDYLEKPFSMRELMLRVESLLRRGSSVRPEARPTIRFGGNRIDLEDGSAVAWDGSRHRLSRAELGVFQVLLEGGGDTVNSERILEEVWRDDVFPSTRTVRRLVEGLARKFERDPDAPSHFHALRGQGFRFTREPENGPE